MDLYEEMSLVLNRSFILRPVQNAENFEVLEYLCHWNKETKPLSVIEMVLTKQGYKDKMLDAHPNFRVETKMLKSIDLLLLL